MRVALTKLHDKFQTWGMLSVNHMITQQK